MRYAVIQSGPLFFYVFPEKEKTGRFIDIVSIDSRELSLLPTTALCGITGGVPAVVSCIIEDLESSDKAATPEELKDAAAALLESPDLRAALEWTRGNEKKPHFKAAPAYVATVYYSWGKSFAITANGYPVLFPSLSLAKKAAESAAKNAPEVHHLTVLDYRGGNYYSKEPGGEWYRE